AQPGRGPRHRAVLGRGARGRAPQQFSLGRAARAPGVPRVKMVAAERADMGPVEVVEAQRLTLVPVLDDQGQAVRGQYFTPSSIARFMASLFRPRNTRCLRLLDAGAGIGSLSASWVEAVSTW